MYLVTPFVGVWIETETTIEQIPIAMSHPSWVCGLKLLIVENQVRGLSVTPFVGVWIETICIALLKCLLMSHPSWVCGLKPPSPGEGHRRLCHTLRGCVD